MKQPMPMTADDVHPDDRIKPMTYLQRLREMANDIALDISELHQPAYNEELRGDIAACEAGARALDVLTHIAAQPNNGGVCDFCGRKHWRDGHESTCIWQQAKTLLSAESK